jgi:hypothetical protein
MRSKKGGSDLATNIKFGIRVRDFSDGALGNILWANAVSGPTFDKLAKPLLGLLGTKHAPVPTDEQRSGCSRMTRNRPRSGLAGGPIEACCAAGKGTPNQALQQTGHANSNPRTSTAFPVSAGS